MVLLCIWLNRDMDGMTIWYQVHDNHRFHRCRLKMLLMDALDTWYVFHTWGNMRIQCHHNTLDISPRCSMEYLPTCGSSFMKYLYTYIYSKNDPNVGKYFIHGASDVVWWPDWPMWCCVRTCPIAKNLLSRVFSAPPRFLNYEKGQETIHHPEAQRSRGCSTPLGWRFLRGLYSPLYIQEFHSP